MVDEVCWRTECHNCAAALGVSRCDCLESCVYVAKEGKERIGKLSDLCVLLGNLLRFWVREWRLPSATRGLGGRIWM